MNSEFDPDTLDCFLEEMLSEKHPPDLRQSILNRLREVPAEDVVRLDSVVAAAMLDMEDLQSPQSRATTKAIETNSVDLFVERAVSEVRSLETESVKIAFPPLNVEMRDKSMVPSGTRWQRWLWGAAGLTAAAGLMMLGNWLSNQNFGTPGVGSIAGNPSEGKSKVDSSNATSSNSIATHTPVEPKPESSGARDRGARDRRVLDASQVPFQSQSPIESNSVIVNNQPARPRKSLSDLEVIEAIDEQMLALWSNQKIDAPESVEPEMWLRRVTRMLLDRDASETDLQLVGTLGSTEGRANFIYRMTLTREFAQRWSKALAKRWMADSGADTSQERIAFESWLEEQIFAGVPLRIVQQRMFAANDLENTASVDGKAESYWLAKLSGLDLQARVETFCRTQLGQNVACARCHDHETPIGQSLADSGFLTSQAGYWGAATILSQWKWSQEESRGSVVTRQAAQELFYEKADGRSAIAIPMSLDGAPIVDSESWSGIIAWTIANPQRSRANVDFVWETLFGSPLVPEYGLTASEGQLERKELQEFLADQWSGKDEDFRQLLMWLSMSKPFAAKSSLETFQTYLAMSGDQQTQWRKRDRMFAQFVPLGGRTHSHRGNESLRNLTEWIQSNRSITLGSPSLAVSGNSASGNAALGSTSLFEKYGASLERLVAHSQRVDGQLEAQLSRWSKATTMTWEQKVHHASMIVGETSDQAELVRLATELLSLSGGDTEVALRRMMAARSDL